MKTATGVSLHVGSLVLARLENGNKVVAKVVKIQRRFVTLRPGNPCIPTCVVAPKDIVRNLDKA